MDLATIQIKVDTRQVKAANEDIQQLGKTGQMTSKKVTAANDDMATSAKSTTSAFKLLGGAMAALGVGALVTSFARTVTESERLKGSLKTMTGSTENAAFAFQELERFASQTPFTLDQSVEGFIKLKALGLDPSERALRSYGNTSAAMGKDMMQMIEAVADASTGEFERLKEFGIKASKEGDRVSLTFQGMTTTIGNSSAEIQEYLLGIGETKFGSAMADQMTALPGLLSNLEDNVAALFRKIGDVGGINLFAGAITAASAVILGITNNIEALTIGAGAALAGFLAFSVGTNATVILRGFKSMQLAVLALNTAIRANPIGFIAAAIAAATVAIVSNWDSIRRSAERAGLNIQIAFEKLNIFLLESVGGALDSLIGMFTGMQNTAVATMAAVAAAVKNPTNAFDAFNETFDSTLASLETGNTRTNIYSDSIAASRDRVEELNGKLAGMNTEVVTSDSNLVEAGRSLSDFAIEVDESAVAAAEMAAQTEAARVKTQDLLGTISNETEALTMSNVEIAIRNNLQKAGVDATSELGQQIVKATTQLYAEKDAIDSASAAAKQLEKDNEATQKAIEKETKRVAEEAAKAYEKMKNNISGFFMDLFENGRDAFDNLAKTFKNMILQMIADWAASKIADLITGTFGGIGTSISGMFSGMFASIGSGIASLASSAASALTGGAIGGGGAAATRTAITAGTSSMAANAALGAAAAGGTAAVGSAAASQAAIAAGTATMGASAAAAASSAAAAQSAIAAGTATMSSSAAAAAGGSAAAGGGAAAGSSAFSNALATAGPYAAAIIAAYLVAKALDSGGTPTSTAGLTMAKTGGMSDANIFQMGAFESGFAPLGFKQNATNAQAEAAISPLRALDSALTSITKEAGFGVNLSGHTFSGLGVEGSGSGTILGSFVEEGKMKGESIENQMNRYATEWIKAVGARNNITSADISSIIGDGTAPGIVARAQAVLDAQAASAASDTGASTVNAGNMGVQQTIGDTGLTEEELRNLSDTQVGNLVADGKFSAFQAANFYQDRYPGLTVNDVKASMAAMGLTMPSHRDGLNMVPYDGYVAELHAGERVQTADQARASDNVADEMSGLRQSIEDVMIAVARNTQKLYRLNDRWDKNGLPPVRA